MCAAASICDSSGNCVPEWHRNSAKLFNIGRQTNTDHKKIERCSLSPPPSAEPVSRALERHVPRIDALLRPLRVRSGLVGDEFSHVTLFVPFAKTETGLFFFQAD